MADRQRLKLMWDYDAFPVWSDDAPARSTIAPDRLPISGQLREDLQRWSDAWTDVMWGDGGPDSKKWRAPADETRREWDARGRALVRRLRDELGPQYVIGYMNEESGEVEWPDAP